MSPWLLLAFGASHALAVVAGVWLGAAATEGRLLPRRVYKPTTPPPSKPMPRDEDLMRAALANPAFGAATYLGEEPVPGSAIQQAILKRKQAGQPSVLQGEVKR